MKKLAGVLPAFSMEKFGDDWPIILHYVPHSFSIASVALFLAPLALIFFVKNRH